MRIKLFRYNLSTSNRTLWWESASGLLHQLTHGEGRTIQEFRRFDSRRPLSSGSPRSWVLTEQCTKSLQSRDFRKAVGTPSWGELGISTGTVIDAGVRGSAQSTAANSLTFGWSSNMAKLVAEHKTKTLNKDQGQVKVARKPVTSRKPSRVRSFLLWGESETSCFLFGQGH